MCLQTHAYRSPSSKEYSSYNLLKVVTKASELCMNTRLFIMGDFNFPIIDYISSGEATGPESAPYKLFTITQV